MSEPLPNLLDPLDFAKFKAKDESWFLGVAGEAIRDWCGWHIYPVVPMINVQAEIGNKGIIMLPSLNVVSVEELRTNDGLVIPEACYNVHASGWIQLGGHYLAGTGGFVAPRGSQGPLRWVSVDFTHGFEQMPKAVAEVGFELTGKTMEKPAGVVSDLTSGPYRFKFNEFGAGLTEGQAARLAAYTIEGV